MWQKGDGKLTFNYQEGQHKDWEIRPIVGGDERLAHPTQKPLTTMRDFIRWWSNKGDVIIDPFMGSATTAIACIETGRQFIGFEANPEYFKIAKERINIAKNQTKMFTV